MSDNDTAESSEENLAELLACMSAMVDERLTSMEAAIAAGRRRCRALEGRLRLCEADVQLEKDLQLELTIVLLLLVRLEEFEGTQRWLH